jgi:hypothetical protein
MMSHRLPLFAAATLCALAASSASGAAYDIDITSPQTTYIVGDTAQFAIEVTKNGNTLNQGNLVVSATFPDAEHVVQLDEVDKGAFTYDTQLLEPGSARLSVSLRKSHGNATSVIQARIDNLVSARAQTEARLQQATSSVMQIVLRARIRTLDLVVAVMQRILDRMDAPLAIAELTIVVEPDTTDTTAPVFASAGPYGWDNDPHPMVWAEVSDQESGIADVTVEVAILEDDDFEVLYEATMSDDGSVHYYIPSEALQDGWYRFIVTATDNAGNTAVEYVYCGVDTVAPVFTSFTPEVTDDTTPTMVIVVIDDDSGVDPNTVELWVGSTNVTGAVYSDGVIVYTLNDQVVGPVYITASAGDLAGNVGVAEFVMLVLP